MNTQALKLFCMIVLGASVAFAAASCDDGGEGDGDSDADSDSDADGDSDADSDSDADGDSDADSDGDADGDSDGDGDRCGEGIALPMTFIFPEGIDRDSDGNLYVGSAITGEIVRVPESGGEGSTFLAAGAGSIIAALGLFYDGARELLWVCSSDIATFLPGGLVGLNLADGSEAVYHPFPEGQPAFCNDITMDSDGDLYVTNSAAPQIFRLPAASATVADSLELWATDPLMLDTSEGGMGTNGIAWDGDSSIYAVMPTTGALLRIPIEDDGSAGAVEQVETSDLLIGGDGLELLRPGVLGVVQNSAINRLAEVDLTASPAEVSSIAIGLDWPATFALGADGGTAYITETQFDKILLHNPPLDPEMPFCIARAPMTSE